LLDGKFLEGNNSPRLIHEAGLPDIFIHYTFQGFDIGGGNQVPLYLYCVIGAEAFYNATGADRQLNPVYGKSNTVQPYSYTVLYIMKISN